MSARKAAMYRRAAEYSLVGGLDDPGPHGGCISIKRAGGSYSDRSFKYWFGKGRGGYWWNLYPDGSDARTIALLLMAHIAEDAQ